MARGPHGRAGRFHRRALTIKHTLSICAPSVSQHAALAALRGAQDCIQEARSIYDERRRAFEPRLAELEIGYFRPAGTFYVFAEVSRAGIGSDEFCEDLLRKARVFVYPGRRFGEHGEGFVRISLLASTARLLEGLDRIGKYLETLSTLGLGLFVEQRKRNPA
ncbi:MAG: aminotransferase class I/II-fold pyridoxal phosphate-dependent enzyme [Desulfobacterales bacterium]|nr:aminotransferase class I/II-fold pyridoxal phosphate-dependent enzyme [Desulfobacterales bacterium]